MAQWSVFMTKHVNQSLDTSVILCNGDLKTALLVFLRHICLFTKQYAAEQHCCALKDRHRGGLPSREDTQKLIHEASDVQTIMFTDSRSANKPAQSPLWAVMSFASRPMICCKSKMVPSSPPPPPRTRLLKSSNVTHTDWIRPRPGQGRSWQVTQLPNATTRTRPTPLPARRADAAPSEKKHSYRKRKGLS